MRLNLWWICAATATAGEDPQCSMNDLMNLSSDPLISSSFTSCIGGSIDPNSIVTCLQSAAQATDNACIECLVGAIDADSITCMVNCAMNPSPGGGDCDACSMNLANRVMGKCLPAELASLMLGGGMLSPGGGQDHHRHSDEGTMMCDMGDLEHMIPHGRKSLDNFISCVDELSSNDWSPCYPNASLPSNNCTDCISSVLAQIQVSCYTDCSSFGHSSCQNCLRNSASTGIGLCTGLVEPPQPSPCNVTDASIYFEGGESTLIDCMNAGGDVVACLGQSSAIGSNCLGCLASSPAWSSTPVDDCGCAPGNVTCSDACPTTSLIDNVSVGSCFDPYSFRRPSDTEDNFPESETAPGCSMDDVPDLVATSETMSQCLANGGAVDTCIDNSTAKCPQCIQAYIATTSGCDSAQCWDKLLTTGIGSCLYGGVSVQSLSISRESLNPSTTTTTTSDTSLRSISLPIFVSFLFIIATNI